MSHVTPGLGRDRLYQKNGLDYGENVVYQKKIRISEAGGTDVGWPNCSEQTIRNSCISVLKRKENFIITIEA